MNVRPLVGLLFAALVSVCPVGVGMRSASSAPLPPLPVAMWSVTAGWQVATRLVALPETASPSIELLNPPEDAEWVEGDLVTVLWQWTGPITHVRLYCQYEKCMLGGRRRGEGEIFITGLIPNRGFFTWSLPSLDAPGFRLRVGGYGPDGKRLAWHERYVRLRPQQARDLHGTFIVVLRDRQRLYFFKDDRLVRMHIVSTARAGYLTPPMAPGTRRGGVAMGRVFRKVRYAWSNRYNSPMPYWLAITSNGSHGIHATVPSAYRHLGRPASHGCIRQHLRDAEVLYNMVEVGTPVYVF
ncbi:MAG: L,D-transpeptidase [Armatimonadetes bacterium]|nr:L,D-transpeptidase [Armatimonadota bacterium]